MIIIGTGAVAAEISMFFSDFIEGYLEYPDNIDKYYNKYNLKAPVLGDIDNFNAQGGSFILGVGSIEFRKKVIEKIKNKGGRFINLIYHTAIVSDNVKMGEGDVIYPGCIISTNVEIGCFNLLTCQSILSHDCKLGDNNILATSLHCGYVQSGSNNLFGIRSTVIPGVSIGIIILFRQGRS